MKMQPPSGSLSTKTLILTLCLALSLPALAAEPIPKREASLSSPGSVFSFPLLRWLRDSAIEVVFGSRTERTNPDGNTSNGADYAAVQARYRHDVVVRFNVTNQGEEQALSEAADRLFLDVWAVKTREFVDVRLHRDDLPSLLTLLPQSLQQPLTLVTDVAEKVWGTYPQGKKVKVKTQGSKKEGTEEMFDHRMLAPNVPGVDNLFFSDYQPLSVITSWLRLLEAMFPTYVKLISIGTSYEGRDIPGIRMGAPDEGGNAPEPGSRKTILITGGIHAREWISTSTVNYLIWSLTTAYGKEPMITRLLQRFDVVLVPVVNPDGYEYTWQTDRLWRKSRQMTSMRFCRGLDLDHAFGYEWDATKHQTDPCSESYGGDQPFQAVEASQLAQWAKNESATNAVKFIGLLDLHSYSQQILFPYSYTCSVDPPNRENLEELAVGLAKAIRLSSGESYGVASACEGAVARVYSASDSMPRIESGGGSAIDWFYHEMGARFSYQIKLRDTGSYGFLLPPDNIVPTGEEIYNALKYFGDFLLGNNGIEKLGSNKGQPKGGEDEVIDDKRTDLRRRKFSG